MRISDWSSDVCSSDLVLQVLGAPVGRELGRYAFHDAVGAAPASDDGKLANGTADDRGDGSVIVVIATDAPVGERNLGRIASRALLGLGRTGNSASNGDRKTTRLHYSH